MQAPELASTRDAAALRQRATDLRARLAELADRGAEERRLPAQSVAAMQEAGFFRILQPPRWGGYGLDPMVFFDVQRRVAHGCPSSAWVLGVVGVHAWQLALFDERAQSDVWGENPSALISSSYAPVGEVSKVEGGFRLSGRWSFSSGCDHCQWVFVGAFVPAGEGRPPDMRTFLVPRSDYRIEDRWRVSGLCATGSNDIVIEDVFVPSYRTHRFADGFRCASPGQDLNPEPLYRLPFGQVFVRSVSTTAIGIAETALEVFLETARSRVSTADQSKMELDPTVREVAARADAELRSIRAVFRQDMEAMMQRARANEAIPVEDRVRYRYASSQTVERCVAVVDRLFENSGGRAIFLDHPMNRLFQDVHAARAHFANNPVKPGRNLGRVLMGLPTEDYFL